MSSNSNTIKQDLTQYTNIGNLYSTEVISRAKLLECCISTFGSECMLGGIVDRGGRLSLHHIIPQKIVKLNCLDNMALLSRGKHDVVHELELHSKELATEINAYLYFFRGKCDTIDVLERIKNLIVLGENQISLNKSAKKFEYINNPLDISDKDEYEIPPYLFEVIDILEKHYADIYKRIKVFLTRNKSSRCSETVHKSLTEIIHLAEKESLLIKRYEFYERRKLEILESMKQGLNEKLKKYCI